MTTTMGYPGVYTTEQLNPIAAPNNSGVGSPSLAGFIGEWWKGPTVPVLCNSWNDFVINFGGFNPNSTPVLTNPYLGYSVYEFFANGGVSCWVYRLVKGFNSNSFSGNSASVNLLDSAATATSQLTLTTGGSGVQGNIGTWGNNLLVTVTNATINATPNNRFNLNIYYNPTGTTTASFQYLVESWADLSMLTSDPRYVVNLLNNPSSGSRWVYATDSTSSTGNVYPYNTPKAASYSFSSGTDPNASPAPGDYIAALNYGQSANASTITAPFDNVAGMLNINLPGFSWDSGTSGITVMTAAINYAAQRPSTFLVVDPPVNTPVFNLTTTGGFQPTIANATGYSSYAATYYPWIVAPNPASSNLQSSITLPPGGFVLGQMASTDTGSGPWYAPAGISTNLVNAVSTERTFSPSDLTTLTQYGVNAIRQIANNNTIVIWGARTHNQSYSTKYVPVRRTLNYIEASLNNLLQYAVFEPNTPALWGSISASCNAFLGGMLASNAFPSNLPNSSYYVICDGSINTPQTIAQGVVNTKIGVALLYPSEFISITISQFQSTGSTTVSAA